MKRGLLALTALVLVACGGDGSSPRSALPDGEALDGNAVSADGSPEASQDGASNLPDAGIDGTLGGDSSLSDGAATDGAADADSTVPDASLDGGE